MPLAVRPNYINPLTMMKKQEGGAKALSVPVSHSQNKEEKSEVEKLQEKQQLLQNQLLLMKSSSDGAAASADIQKEIEAQLTKVAEELKTAESSPTAEAGKISSSMGIRARFDEYVQSSGVEESAGIYSLKPGDGSGYRVSFRPYTDGTEVQDKAPEQVEAPSGQSSAMDGASEVEDQNKALAKSEETVTNCTVDTGKVDDEIEQLKQETANLEQQISDARRSGKSQEEIDRLRAELSAASSELRAKDNDGYRKQHASYFYS